MSRRLNPGAALLLLVSAAIAQEETAPPHADWFADFDKAQAAAKEGKKDLLVDFTGSDWCGWCIRLDKEVFAEDAFKAGVKDHFVLVALDFPADDALKAKVPNPARNEELQGKYGVQGFPTVLLMTADGVVYGRTGYRPGGAAPYVEHLNELRTVARARVMETLAFAKKVEVATGDERGPLLDDAVKRLAAMSEEDAAAPVLADILEKALAEGAFAGKGNESDVVKALLEAGRSGQPVRDAAVRLDPKNEKGLRELVVAAVFQGVDSEEAARAALTALDEVAVLGIKDKDLAMMLHFNAANWCHRALDLPDRAKGYARTLKSLAPDNEDVKEFCKAILGDE